MRPVSKRFEGDTPFLGLLHSDGGAWKVAHNKGISLGNKSKRSVFEEEPPIRILPHCIR